MAEQVWGRPEQLVIPLSEGVATLYEEEHISSPILRACAYSMWNECSNLYEEGRAEPQHEFSDVDEFIEYMKKTGVPEEIRSNQELLVKVLSVGIATLYEKADVDSPILHKVAYSIRKHCGEIAGQPRRESPMKALPRQAMTIDEAVAEMSKHQAPDDPEGKRWQIVQKVGDSVYFDLEAPKDEAGNYICGCMLVRGGVLTTRTQLFKVCVVCDLAVIKNALERLIKHPVVAEQIDGPAIREGADSCSAVMHLIPPGGRLL